MSEVNEQDGIGNDVPERIWDDMGLSKSPTPAVEVSGGLPLAIWMEVKIDETLNGNQIRCSAAVYAALTHFMSRRAAKGGESNG